MLFGPVAQVIRHAAYSRSGHLVYQRVDQNPGIWAIAVDPRTLRPRAEPFLVASGGLRPSVAADGTLVYVTDESWGQVRLSFINRGGVVVRDVGEPRAALRHPALSPAQDRIAFVAPSGEKDDLWMIDVAAGLTTRVTFTGVRGDPEFSLDGTRLLYILLDQTTRTDVWTAPLDQSSPPHLIRQSPAFDFGPRISPDGRWVAYGSSEGGQPMVFIADYPQARRRWQVSTGSGAQAEWNPPRAVLPRWQRSSPLGGDQRPGPGEAARAVHRVGVEGVPDARLRGRRRR